MVLVAKMDEGRHTIWVIPRVQTRDEYNSPTWTDGEPVKVRCLVQVMSSDEQMALGLQAKTTYQIYARSWPWDMHSKVIWEGFDGEWPNRKWAQQGEAKRYGTGYFTQHCTVNIQALEAE